MIALRGTVCLFFISILSTVGFCSVEQIIEKAQKKCVDFERDYLNNFPSREYCEAFTVGRFLADENVNLSKILDNQEMKDCKRLTRNAGELAYCLNEYSYDNSLENSVSCGVNSCIKEVAIKHTMQGDRCEEMFENSIYIDECRRAYYDNSIKYGKYVIEHGLNDKQRWDRRVFNFWHLKKIVVGPTDISSYGTSKSYSMYEIVSSGPLFLWFCFNYGLYFFLFFFIVILIILRLGKAIVLWYTFGKKGE